MDVRGRIENILHGRGRGGLFSKRSLHFSHEIDLDHLELIYADLISQRRGREEGRLFLERFAARYTERVKEEKPWWPKSFMGFNQANERSVCRDAGSFALMKSLLSPPCLILRQLVLFRVRSPSVNRDGHHWPSP